MIDAAELKRRMQDDEVDHADGVVRYNGSNYNAPYYVARTNALPRTIAYHINSVVLGRDRARKLGEVRTSTRVWHSELDDEGTPLNTPPIMTMYYEWSGLYYSFETKTYYHLMKKRQFVGDNHTAENVKKHFKINTSDGYQLYKWDPEAVAEEEPKSGFDKWLEDGDFSISKEHPHYNEVMELYRPHYDRKKRTADKKLLAETNRQKKKELREAKQLMATLERGVVAGNDKRLGFKL